MVVVLLTLLAVAGAIAPWWLFWHALRVGRRLCRPRLVRRHGRVPVAYPPSLAKGLLTIALSVAVFAGWLVFTQPLWSTYTIGAWEYRQHGAAAANLMSRTLAETGWTPGPSQTRAGYVHQPVAQAGEPFLAALAFYWRDAPDATESQPNGSPVETIVAPGAGGTFVLTYRRDLAPGDQDRLRRVLASLQDSTDLPLRRPAHDLPLLVRSVLPHWRGFAGVLDTAAGAARGITGLGLLPPLYLVAVLIGGFPGPY